MTTETLEEKTQEREKRQFFYADDEFFKVTETTGYSCAGEANPNSDYWWCPSVGYSACVGTSLFDTYDEAKAKVIEAAKKKRAEIDDALAELEGK